MSEHGRIVDFAGNQYQWVDTEMVMLLDEVTGEPCRFGPYVNTIGRLSDALVIARASPQGPPRYVIVKLECIRCYLLEKLVEKPERLRPPDNSGEVLETTPT